MDKLHKKIIEILTGFTIEDDDLILDKGSSKFGLRKWVIYSINKHKEFNRSIKALSWHITNPNDPFPDGDSILGWLVTHIVLSENEFTAIERMKRIKPNRDWNLFEIDKIIVDGIQYTVVWD